MNVQAFCIEDLRKKAQRRIPRIAYDFVAGGAGLDDGVRENSDAFERRRFIPRALVDVRNIDLSKELFGRRWDLPFAIAPMGFANLVWPRADEALARSAVAANIPYCLSTAATTGIEPIAQAAPDHTWFQLYILKSDEVVDDLLKRAASAGVDVLLVTVDVPMASRRLRDLRNGFALPLRASPSLALDLLAHPSWCLATARQGAPRLVNMEPYAGAASTARALAEFLQAQNFGKMDWSVLRRIRDTWPGRLVIKGLLSPDDSVRAREIGADGIVVSNHGGRQLEGAVAPFAALPAIRAAVGADYPLLLDGGIRSGEHVLKALAAGASFVLVGRAAMYGVAAAGADGIRAAIDILRDEALRGAAHLGVTSMDALSPDYLWPRRDG